MHIGEATQDDASVVNVVHARGATLVANDPASAITTVQSDPESVLGTGTTWTTEPVGPHETPVFFYTTTDKGTLEKQAKSEVERRV